MLRGANHKSELTTLVWDEIRKKNFNQGLAHLTKVSDGKKSDEWFYMQARCFSGLKKYNSALDSLSKVKNRNKKDVLLCYARCYQETRRYHDSIASIHEIANWETDKDSLLSLARCFQKMGKHKNAIDYYSKILIINPRDRITLLSLARCYEEMSQYDNAIDVYNNIPHWDDQILISIARCYETMGENEKAINIFFKIFNWQTQKSALIGIARCYQKLAKFSEAIKYFCKISNWDRDTEALLGIGRCHQVSGQPDEAIKFLKKIINWKTNKQALLGIGRCQEETGRYIEAVTTFQMIPNWEKDKDVLLALLLCHQKNGEYEKALSVYKILPKEEVDTQVLISLARCYQEMGKYDDVINTLNGIPDWDKNKEALLVLAHCYAKMGNFDDAIEIFYKSLALGRDKVTLLGMARCYEEMGKFEEALKTYQSIPTWDKTTLISLARCYEEMGIYDEALQTYYRIPNYDSDKQALISLARCFQDMGRYDESIKISQKVHNWNKDKEALLGLARCYQKMNKHQEALNAYWSIPRWRENPQVLVSLARCYQEMGKYNQALNTYHAVPNWSKNRQTLISLARCYEEMGCDEEAREAYLKVIKKFPYYQDAVYHYCRYVIKNRYTNAGIVLDEFINRWPHLNTLQLLKARYENQRNNSAAAHLLLKQTIERFPYFIDAYLDLIRHYLSINQTQKAIICQEHCKERFVGHYKLLKQIHTLMQEETIIREWGDDYSLEKKENKKVNLSPLTRSALALISDLSNQYYIVGSTVHALLNDQPLNFNQSIDLVMTAQGITKIIPRLSPNPHNPQLYNAKVNGVKINCYVVNKPHESFVSHNVRSRAFTVTSLYCDPDGNILDPSGLGLSDFKKKILRTIGNAVLCFQEDPIRLLHAVNYIVKGYAPTQDVKNAITTWKPGELNMPHVQAVVCKHLLSFDITEQLQYVKALQDYGLLQKIFGITPKETLELTLLELKKMLDFLAVQRKKYVPARFFQEKTLEEKIYEVYTPSLFPRYIDVLGELKVKYRGVEALNLHRQRPR